MCFWFKFIYVHVFFTLNLRNCLGQSDEYPVVTIENGQIRGRQDYTVGENKTYYAFQGIPYAEPPLGELRFTDPVKVSNWTGILNTTEDRSPCVQGSDPVEGQEDCLFINVYTPSLSGAEANKSVMVWIYGGAFTGGYSTYEEYGPDFLLDQDVVYVSLNYRVGIWGFLSTEDTTIPGNWGLKDQLLALEWVQNNIEYFGGNASDVTVFGQSAGAASITYLLQSNRSRGLFSRVILESGSSLCLWALNRRAKRIAFSTGVSLGILTTNSTVLLEELREINYETLQTTATTVSTAITLENALEGLFFSPVIEPDHEGAVVVNRSDEQLLQGDFNQVPILMGLNSNEAAAIGAIPDIIRLYLLTYDVATEDLAPYDLAPDFLERLIAAVRIRARYFGLGLIAGSSSRLIQFISDDQFNRPVRRAAQSTSQYVPVYFYVFSYEGNLFGVTNRNFSGVGHSEELGYLFERSVVEVSNVTESDELTRARLVTLWTNFAKYGNPTPFPESLLENITWESVGTDSSALQYLDINTNLTLEENPFEESMNFYDDIYETYGVSPHDTY